MSKERPRQFVVGDVNAGADFSKDYIESLVYRIALWFQQPECDRTYENPAEVARQKLIECLLGTTEDGSPWRQVPREFAARVRAKCAYDIDENKGIPSRRNKKTAPKRVLSKEAQDAAREMGESDTLVTFDVEEFRTRMQTDILANFPELDNPVHLPNVRSLIMYYVEREKIDAQLGLGVSDNKRLILLDSLKRIEDMADTTMKRLGVHPDQIRKKISDKGASTIADLVSLVSNDEDFKKREKTWALQLALQLWWMSQHRNGEGTGPQLHDFEIWHMTRSRPMQFTCRHGEEYTLIEGFEPTELRDFLLREGVLIEEPLLPGVYTHKDLLGLATAGLEDNTDDTAQEAHAGDGRGSDVAEGDAGSEERLSGQADPHTDGGGDGTVG